MTKKYFCLNEKYHRVLVPIKVPLFLGLGSPGIWSKETMPLTLWLLSSQMKVIIVINSTCRIGDAAQWGGDE